MFLVIWDAMFTVLNVVWGVQAYQNSFTFGIVIHAIGFIIMTWLLCYHIKLYNKNKGK